MSATPIVRSPPIRFTGVFKAFAGRQVLRGVDLDVPDGTTVALVGINGAGKTTCIKSLLDFSSVDAGRIELSGVAHTDPRARRDLFFLPERFVPPGFLTGNDYLRHAARLHGSAEDAQRGRTAQALDIPEEALARPVREYSKGMVQKLGLAAAFLSQRSLLLLDEPMSGLDPRARILVKRQLESERGQGRTVLLTTHMLADAEAFCDRMAILSGGVVVFSGSPAECRQQFGGTDLEEAFLNCLALRGDAA